MNDFTKIYRIGTNKTQDGRAYSIFVKATYQDNRLSITGVEGPTPGGNCIGSCGQIVMSMDPTTITPAPGWSQDKILRLITIWNKWHLNDLKSECDHQRTNWNFHREIEVTEFTWTTKFSDMRKRASQGTMSIDEYRNYKETAPMVYRLTTDIDKMLFTSDMAIDALKQELIKIESKTTEKAYRIPYSQHPGGMLGKPCEICGYKYGSKWLKEEVPDNVLQELLDLPDTDIKPIWI